jgi:uncharacterized protein YbjT (DUF2867 family)
MMILAFGAAADFAGSVVPALATRGSRVRAFIRKPEQAELVRGHGATEVAIGDLRDRAVLDAALKDVGVVFYIAPAAAALPPCGPLMQVKSPATVSPIQKSPRDGGLF